MVFNENVKCCSTKLRILVQTKVKVPMCCVHGHDLVTDLPTSLSCFILGDWVSRENLCRLNSAYCCHEKRGVVLDIFQSKELLSKDYLQSYKINRVSREYWDWILLRDLKLFNIAVGTSGADEQQLESYAKRHERHIGHLELAVENPSSLVLHCKHLVQLTCNMKVNPAFEKVLQNNPSLQILDVREEHIESLKTIRLPLLTQLKLAVGVCSVELKAAVLAMPARLLKLHLSEIDTDLTGVAQHCPHLRSLSLDMNYDGFEVGSDFDLIEFTSHLPHLVNLQLVDIVDLNDAKFHAVVQNVEQLHMLNLKFFKSDCDLTDAGIGHIAEHCAATLEVFSLGISDSGIKITHVSLDQLRARCTKMRQFHIKAPFGYSYIPLSSVTILVAYCSCVDSTLVKIANECPQLEVLLLKSGANVCTLPTLRALCQKCPKLHRTVVDKWSVPYWKSLTVSLPPSLIAEFHSGFNLDVMKMPI